MSSQKCANCGLVSWAETTTCKRCGESLLDQDQSDRSTHDRAKYSHVPDIVSCSLFVAVGACFALAGYSVAYRVSMVALVIGLGYSLVRVYRSTRQPPLERKRDAVIALVGNALLLISLVFAVPVYFLTTDPETKRYEWREYASVNGRYTIQLPDAPQEVHQTTPTARGSLTLNGVTANMGQRGEYVSGYYELSDPAMIGSDEEVLDLVFQNAAHQDKRMVMTKYPLVISSPNGLKIKAFEADLQLDVNNSARVRMYWVNERSTVYMNLVTFRNATRNDVSAGRFLDSFQLTPQ